MKKISTVLLSCLLILTVFCGCGSNDDGGERLQIVCTVFPQYDFVRNIAGDKADVRMLVPLGTESHDFQFENLTVADLRSVASADMVISVGGESDSGWISRLRSTVKSDGIAWLNLLDMTEPIEEESADSMEHAHTHDHDHGGEQEHSDGRELDEHVWTSPKRAIEIVSAITEALCEQDSENSQIYRENAKKYTESLQLLDTEMTEVAKLGEGKMLIFGDRFPFGYLCADYGLSFDAAFPGCSASADPTVAQITSLTKNAGKYGVSTVFYMENSNPVFAKKIAESVNGTAELLHSCHTLSREELDGGEDYVKIMSRNIEKIAEAFK